MRCSSGITDQTAPSSVRSPSQAAQSGTPSNGVPCVPPSAIRVRHEGRPELKLRTESPAGVTCAPLNPCRLGAHQPSADLRVARSTLARQYDPLLTVACSSRPSPSAQVPPFVVGTSDLPSIVKVSPVASSVTTARLGCCSVRSWRTATAQSASISASLTRRSDPPPPTSPCGPSSDQDAPLPLTVRVQPPPRVTL